MTQDQRLFGAAAGIGVATVGEVIFLAAATPVVAGVGAAVIGIGLIAFVGFGASYLLNRQ